MKLVWIVQYFTYSMFCALSFGQHLSDTIGPLANRVYLEFQAPLGTEPPKDDWELNTLQGIGILGDDLILGCNDDDSLGSFFDPDAALVRFPLNLGDVSRNQFEILPSLNGVDRWSLVYKIINVGKRTLILGTTPSDNATGLEYNLGLGAAIWDEDLNVIELNAALSETYAATASDIAHDGTYIGWELDPIANRYFNFIGSIFLNESILFPYEFSPNRLLVDISKDGNYIRTGPGSGFGVGGLILRRTSLFPLKYEPIPDSFLQWPAVYAEADFQDEWLFMANHPVHGTVGIRRVFHLSNDERIFSEGVGVWRMCDGAFLKDLGFGGFQVAGVHSIGSTLAIALDVVSWTDTRTPNSRRTISNKNVILTLDGEDFLDIGPLTNSSPYTSDPFVFAKDRVFFQRSGSLGVFLISDLTGLRGQIGNYVALEFPIIGQFVADRVGEFDGINYRLPNRHNEFLFNQFASNLAGVQRMDGIDTTGDGVDEQVVYLDGEFLIDTNQNGVWDLDSGGDRSIRFGFPGDFPITGDWNGDGRDDVGVRRGASFRLDMNGNGFWDGPILDLEFGFGRTSEIPVVGDWNGDGIDDIGTFIQGGTFRLDLDGDRRWNPSGEDQLIQFTQVGELPVIGDWNGDGLTDIGVRKSRSLFLDLNGDLRWNGKFFGDFHSRLSRSVRNTIVGQW